MKNDLDVDFADINEESKYKNYVIVCVLYVVVIALTVILVLGLKHQKDVVKDTINSQIDSNQIGDNL